MAAEAEFDPEQIVRTLNAHRVAYVVVGGFAAAAHGVVRATADLDVVVERSWENAGRLAAALRDLEASAIGGETAALEAGVLVRRADRRFRTAHGQLHLLHEVAGVPAYRELVPAEELGLGDETVPVSGLADLRRMKRASDRLKDRADLEELAALHGEQSDSAAD